MEYLLLILGFIMLIKGADLFVDGSSNIAKFFRIPSIIVGLTLVAFGTSAPELAVSISAAIKGNADIAISNVVGSNIFNLLSVLGITALFRDIKGDKGVIKKDYKISIFVAMLLLIIILVDFAITGTLMLGRIGGLVLLGVFGIYLYDMIKNTKKEEEEKLEKVKFNIKDLIFVVLGLSFVIFGGDLTVDNAVVIAKSWGLSERFIGLTIIAIGTSLPELCTSLVAMFKGENDIAVGNVIGSNIFNILLILGASSVISPLTIGIETIIDILVLIVCSIGVLFMFSDFKLKRKEAISMVSVYVIYCIYIFIR